MISVMPTSQEPWTWQRDEVFPSDTRTGRQVLEQLLRELEAEHWTEHDIFCVHLAVYEALINAIVHGNEEDRSKKVHFVCRVSPQLVRVEITDEGSGFCPELLPDPTDDAFLDRPCGRGVLLMRAFMSRVSFNPRGNHVVLERDRSETPRQKKASGNR
jgi:serine/threonine-protein kinase RsbW